MIRFFSSGTPKVYNNIQKIVKSCQADIKMFHLILFVLGLSFSVCLSTPKCLEQRSFGFLDCSGLMLNDTVQLPAVRDFWVEHPDLRMNRFVSINFTKLILAYPNLRTVDVRDNVAFDCRMSRGLRIFIRSNCNCKSVSSIISAKTPSIVPPTSIRTTYGIPVSSTTSAKTPSLLPPTSIRTTYGMPVFSTTSAKTPSLLPPTSIRTTYGMPVSSTTSAKTPFLLPPTSIRTTYGMPVSSTTLAKTPFLLLPTSIRTTYGMPVSSTTSAKRHPYRLLPRYARPMECPFPQPPQQKRHAYCLLPRYARPIECPFPQPFQ